MQRQEQSAFNTWLRTDLPRRGPVFNDVDPAPFRRRLSGVYATWKRQLGTTCWSLLEQTAGPLS